MAHNTFSTLQPLDTQKVGIQPNESVYLAALAAPCQCQLGENFRPSKLNVYNKKSKNKPEKKLETIKKNCTAEG